MTVPESSQPNSKQDSSEKVHFLESGSYKYMSGERKPTGIRVDSGLYKRFKQVSKAIYGSTCRAIELYMIALIETAEKGVHFSDTQHPIKIENIVIERNLRSRRNLEVIEEVAEKVTETKVVARVKRVVKDVDYSLYSLEKLQQDYDRAVGSQNHVKQMMVRAEFNRRGLKPVKNY